MSHSELFAQRKPASSQFMPKEVFPSRQSVPSSHRSVRNMEKKNSLPEELPVITKVSLIRTPEDFKRTVSVSSSSHTIIEPRKKEPEDRNYSLRNSQPIDNSPVLLMLLHQKDLEIKGLKNAARRHPPDRLTGILQELVRTRQKGPLKKNQTEDILRKEIEQLNSELIATKENHMKEMQLLQEKLMRSKLCVLNLQDEVKVTLPKSENGSDTGSNMSLDEGAQLARESFELWSETGNRLLSGKSDLRLRRIPKHTSFVDAFHKFGEILCSEEDKDERVISSTAAHELKEQQHIVPLQSSQESSQTKESQSDASSWAVFTTQKSDLVSTATDTRTTASSSSLPSVMEKCKQRGSIDTRPFVDYWKAVESKFSLGQPSTGKPPWIPVPFTETYKRDSIIAGSLKIVSVHHQGKFVRILNNLLNKEVWAPGANLAQKQPSDTFLSSQGFFRAGPECTTILCNCSGQIVSQYTAPHRFTAAAEAYSDNVDLSVDKFPLTDEKEESLASSWPSKEDVDFPAKTLQKDTMDGSFRALKTRYTGPVSMNSSCSSVWNVQPRTKKRISDSSNLSSVTSFSLKRVSYPRMIKDSHSSSSEDEYFTPQKWNPPLEEPKAKEFKTTLDTTLPMVALIGQKSARSKYGFKYMNYIPTTTDLNLRHYYYGR